MTLASEEQRTDLSEILVGAAAAGLYRALIRDQTVRVRNGQASESWELAVLQALAAAADLPLPEQPRSVRTLRSVETGMICVREGAALVGLDERSVRRLCSEGRVRCQRVGARSWLVDADSLQRVVEKNRHRPSP